MHITRAVQFADLRRVDFVQPVGFADFARDVVVVITVAVAITGVWAGWLFTKLLEFFA
jgi:hypothetical protein